MKNKHPHIVAVLFLALFFLGLVSLGARALYRLGQEDRHAFGLFKFENLKGRTAEFDRRLNLYAGRDTTLFYPLAQWRKTLQGRAIKRQILLGRDNWMFLGSDNFQADPLQQMLQVPQLTQGETTELQLQYAQRAWWCAQNNMDYWLLITPNKASIYPEFLPEKPAETGPTFLDELIPPLQPAVHQQLIDLRSSLIAHKDQGPLYYHTDTHWNHLGAWWGAQIVGETLQQSGYPGSVIERDSFSFVPQTIPGGDQAGMAMLKKAQFHDQEVEIQYKGENPITPREAPPAYQPFQPYLRQNAEGILPKVLLFHDSFGHQLREYLAYQTQELTALWLWGQFDPAIARQENAPLVLDQIIERNLGYVYPGNDATLVQEYWAVHAMEQQWQAGPVWEEGGLADLRALLVQEARCKDCLYIVRMTVEASEACILEIEDGLYRKFRITLSAGRNVIYWQYNPKRNWSWQWKGGARLALRQVELSAYGGN